MDEIDVNQMKTQRVLSALLAMTKKPTFAEQLLLPLDALLDVLLEDGAFGKKGKNDPRGNQTKSFGGGGPCWTMMRCEWHEG